MPEAKDDLKREKVRIVPISNIEDFPDHPFQVKDDESMDQLVESIRMNGVLNPVIALKIDENHYQLISGHRRKRACILLGIDRIPLIGRDMNKLAQDRGLPRYCYGFIHSSKEEIRIDIAESGYAPYKKGGNINDVLKRNAELGITRPQMEAMKAGSMFGWNVPGADPKNYDENGTPTKKRYDSREER